MKVILKILLIYCLFVLLCKACFAEEIRWDDLIAVIIHCESAGDGTAVSDKGAIGLMQITPIVLLEFKETHRGLNRPKVADELNFPIVPTSVDLYNPDFNKYVGTWYLKRLRDHYLKENYTLERLLCAWSGGITRLRKLNYDCSKMPYESREFTRRVLRLYDNR